MQIRENSCTESIKYGRETLLIQQVFLEKLKGQFAIEIWHSASTFVTPLLINRRLRLFRGPYREIKGLTEIYIFIYSLAALEMRER